MRTLVDIEKDLSTCKLKLVSSNEENKRALEKRIEQLEWERTCTTAERETMGENKEHFSDTWWFPIVGIIGLLGLFIGLCATLIYFSDRHDRIWGTPQEWVERAIVEDYYNSCLSCVEINNIPSTRVKETIILVDGDKSVANNILYGFIENGIYYNIVYYVYRLDGDIEYHATIIWEATREVGHNSIYSEIRSEKIMDLDLWKD